MVQTFPKKPQIEKLSKKKKQHIANEKGETNNIALLIYEIESKK